MRTAIQIDSVGIGSIDFDKIIPQPTGLYMGDLGPREMELYKDNNWYDWRHKHWGTKWNSYGYDREQGIDDNQNQIRFITANRSAFKIIEELSRQYPDVLFEMRYADEDIGYNTGAISFTAGEVIEANLPKDGTLEAQEFAADVMGIKLEFDIDSACLIYRVIHNKAERTYKMDRAIKRGDLVYLNFDPIVGSEQGGPRPAVVIQNDIGNKHAPTVIIVPITSKTKKANLPTHVKLTSEHLERNSMVLLEQIKTIDKSRIESYIGTLNFEEMKKIEKALRISLGMGRYRKKRG